MGVSSIILCRDVHAVVSVTSYGMRKRQTAQKVFGGAKQDAMNWKE